MDIAIIGGGASGLASAYYLSRQGHRITLFERQAELGGHIRTLSQRACPACAHEVSHLEGGVVEFSGAFTQFQALMAELGVGLEPLEACTAMFPLSGRRLLSRGMIARNSRGLTRLRDRAQLFRLLAGAPTLWLRARPDRLRGRPLETVIGNRLPRDVWLRLLAMYCYSTPYGDVGTVPADFALPPLRNYMWQGWMRIPGGVYSYVERILERLNGDVILRADPVRAWRTERGIEVGTPGTDRRCFHRLVLAVPPDQVLQVLADPTAEETRWFGAWRGRHIETIIHTDSRLYRRYGVVLPSEFDFFQTGENWGYNACLNRICTITAGRYYFLAFGLDDMIAEDRIICRVPHHTPVYDVASMRQVPQVIAANGRRGTYHAGAYLYDGLHEGAVRSARRVADLIGPDRA